MILKKKKKKKKTYQEELIHQLKIADNRSNHLNIKNSQLRNEIIKLENKLNYKDDIINKLQYELYQIQQVTMNIFFNPNNHNPNNTATSADVLEPRFTPLSSYPMPPFASSADTSDERTTNELIDIKEEKNQIQKKKKKKKDFNY